MTIPTQNYLQRVGHSSCIRCDFETSGQMTFDEQDRAMMEHLAAEHPGWQTDGGKSIKQDRLPGAVPTLDQIKQQIVTENLYIHQPLFEQRTNQRLLAIIAAIEDRDRQAVRREYGNGMEGAV